MPFLAELTIADDPAAWEAAGFAVEGDVCRLGTVRLRLDPSAGRKGIVSWGLADLHDGPSAVDGLRTYAAELADGAAPEHPNGALSIDHLVVTTGDLPRTIAALEALGWPLRRTRDTDSYGAPMRQAFFRDGEVVIEVVGGPDPAPDAPPARFFGLALTLRSLAAAKDLLGDRMGTPKPAVQPGREITSLKPAAGLTVAVALMSPEPAAG